jgi:hypothetical protein
METRIHRDMETWRNRDIEKWRHEDMDTWTHRYGDIKRKMETEAQPIFFHPFTVCSSFKQKYVICLFVDKEMNRSYSFGF